MPAQNETFYHLKRLHAIFAASAMTLLAVTVWMLWADHQREWKVYQRTFRDRVEPWLTEAKLREEERKEYAAREAKLPAGSKAIAAGHRAAADALRRSLAAQEPNWAKRLLRLPLIDAFGRPLAIQQIWLPELTINYNFCQVPRFDRCTTCHLGVDKTEPGQPTAPACQSERVLEVKLAAPKEPPKFGQRDTAKSLLESIYGLSLAPRGILEPGAATIGLVLPGTAAAQADLLAGDVLVKIDGRPAGSREDAEKRLLNPGQRGRPLSLVVRRGLPRPYASHPRLDLFVGTHSPHPASKFGCTICHEGQGSATEFKFASHTPNGPTQRVDWQREHGWFLNRNWDFPMRPARFVESSCLRCHHDVVDLEPTRRFPDAPAAKLLAGYQLVRQNGCFGCHEIQGVTDTGQRIGPDLRRESGSPENTALGTMRRVGPSLRDLAGRLDAAFLTDWTWQPSRYRPAARMPQFLGMYEHLDGKTLADTKRFEAVEVQAMAHYLLAVSQPVPSLEPPSGITEPASADRGKKLFETRGCLACHTHKDFPEGQANQGPDLSNLGSKYTAPDGARWLVSWLRNPVHHSPRTSMPNTFLEPVTEQGRGGEGDSSRDASPQSSSQANGPRSDPAADLVAYLLASRDWRPKEYPPLVEADLNDLTLAHLTKTYPARLARQYLNEGIPAARADQVQADEAELLTPISREKKIRYVGRRTIRKRGCYGCHDIPGFESAQGIGPVLSDWGRKQESLLAFERIDQFLRKQPSVAENKTDDAFYREAVAAKRREGFGWQKLRAPRSFDYQKAETKGFNEQLLMGRFNFTDAEREAILTFVLGLVAEPPAPKYVCQPDRRRQAIVEGRKALDKYGCALCHTLEMERWQFQFPPEKFETPSPAEDYAFLDPAIASDQVKASEAVDRRGLARAEVVGMPRVDAQGRLLVSEGDEEDQQGDPLPLLGFTLWEPAAINGKTWPVGGADVMIYQHQLGRKRAPWGGDFARLLYPRALADARADGSTAAEMEAWGWGPPPLVHEGSMVQPAWLYEYLLDPYVVRPAAVLRMPKFNLSHAEAAKLVDYFAAVSGAEFPYSSDLRGRPTRLDADQQAHADRYDKALSLVIDRTTYCAKCHRIGDYSPGGETRTILAPNLDRVSRRIRPEYVRRWLANPKSVLPYTAMPVNFPPAGPPIGQDLYPGSSLDQLEAVTDLLLNYDGVLKRRQSIRSLMDQASKPQATPAKGEK
jgi:cbb3-type cytochrome oxidase cytochrome c subunit